MGSPALAVHISGVCYYSPQEMTPGLRYCIIPLVVFVACGLARPVKAAGGDDVLGILTPPAVEEKVIYFVHWPQTLYAFDEAANKLRWSTVLDPPLGDIDERKLPAPVTETCPSYILVHLGRQLWGVSKVDGHTVWSAKGLEEASRDSAASMSNTLPGYYVLSGDADSSVITLEEESGWWFCRSRRLGDGSVEWEHRLNGEPRGWWLDGRSLWIGFELFGSSGPGSANGSPGNIVKLDAGSGNLLWATQVTEGVSLQAVFRVAGQRVYLMERTADGDFQVRGFDEESGTLARSITYSAGDLIAALVSGDKLVFLHREGSPEQNLVRFLLYYSSLNPIRFQTIGEARADQLFSTPAVDGNLLLYAGASYSLYDGKLVWQEHLQRLLVDWAADDYRLYLWDSAGSIQGLDRLTGQEVWKTPFAVLPPDEQLGPHHGGASLALADERLFASTPTGEVYRIDPATGELHPGVLTVREDSSIEPAGRAHGPGEKRSHGTTWLWISITIVVLIGLAFLWFGTRKPQSWSDSNGSTRF